MSRLEVNNDLAPARVPKLQVRNRTPPDQASISTASSGDPRESDDAITLLPSRNETATPSSTSSSSSRPTAERKISTSATRASNGSISPSKSQKKEKKKGPSVLGFLTLKEPSQTALEQFAERTRKQAAEKAGSQNLGRVSAVGLPGVSTQKLPPTVPKVNSKWDGIPESVKAKELAQRRRDSTSTSRSSRSIAGPHGTRLTNHSNGSSSPSVSSSGSQPRGLVLRYTKPAGVFDPAAAGLKTRASLTSPSMSSLPEISYFFPDDANGPGGVAEGTPPETLPIMSKDVSPITVPKESNRISRPNDQVLPTNVDDVAWAARSPTLVEFNTESKMVESQTILKRISLNQGFLAGEAQEVVLPDEDEESVQGAPSVAGDTASEVGAEPLLDLESTSGMEPAAEYMLFANLTESAGELETVQEAVESESEEAQLEEPQSKDAPTADIPAIPTKNPNRSSISPTSPGTTRTNFSRPLSYQTPLESKVLPRPSTANTILPTSSPDTLTILEAATTDDAAVNFASLNRNHNSQHTREYSLDDTVSIAGSVAASSIAPSQMSARWFQSPRERLGLGSRIKKNEAVPWEMGLGERGAVDKKNGKKNRLSLFGKSAA